MCTEEMFCRVLDTDSRSLIQAVALFCPRWLGHVLRISAFLPTLIALFSRYGQG